MSVFERRNKKGEIEYYFRFKIDGKEYYKTVKEATSRTDAEKAETVVKGQILTGNYSLAEKRGSMLFETLVERYKEYARNNKRTWHAELCKVNKIAAYFKGMRLKDISPAILEEYKTYRKNSISRRRTEVSGPTVNRDLAMIGKMFSIAVLNKWIDENPALSSKVKRFEESDDIVRYLTDQEEKNLLNVCIGEYSYLKPIILTALQTGMRLYSEILSLKWDENIDLRNGYITLTKDMTKSKKKRLIPMSSILIQEYKELYKNRSGIYVFANPMTGKPYKDIRDSWVTVRTLAEIDPAFRFHDIRHSMACKLMDKNVNVGVIKDLLGHCSLNVTQKYAHAKDSTKRMAVELLAEGY